MMRALGAADGDHAQQHGIQRREGVGPTFGGFIVATAGRGGFAVNAASYLGIIAVLWRWRPAVEPRVLPREQLGTAMAAGIRYVAMSPKIGTTLLRSLVFGAGACALTALMPLIARDLIGGGAVTYGLLLGAFGVGAVAGAYFSHRLRQLLSNEAIVRWGAAGFAFATIATAFSPFLLVSMLALLLAGAGWGAGARHLQRHRAAPGAALGRRARPVPLPDGDLRGHGRGKLGLGSRDGAAGDHACAGHLPPCCCWRASPRLEARPAGHGAAQPRSRPALAEPEIAMKIAPRSGPVVVTIEYRIRRRTCWSSSR